MRASHSKVNAQNDTDLFSKISMAVLSIQQESGYGSIEIIIHDGKVTQLEKRAKFRIPSSWTNTPSVPAVEK